MKIISPQSYSYKKEIILRRGDEVFLKGIEIDANEEVKLILINNNKTLRVSYNSVYEALEDGWDLSNEEITEFVNKKWKLK